MPDPNAPECDCSVLARLSKEPDIPIGYDPELNEYYIESRSGHDKTAIHHCFFCGGRPPTSRREALFMHVTQAEAQRLKGIVKNLNTLPELLEALGPPDWDLPAGFTATTPAADGQHRTILHRLLSYDGVSPTARLQAIVHMGDRVQFTFVPKPIEKAAPQQPAV